MSSRSHQLSADGVYPSEDHVAAQLALVNAKLPVPVDPTKAANVAPDGSIPHRSVQRA